MLNHQHEQIASLGHMLCKGETDELPNAVPVCVACGLAGGYRKFGSGSKGPPDGHPGREEMSPQIVEIHRKSPGFCIWAMKGKFL